METAQQAGAATAPAAREVDLDAARAARAEGRGEAPTVKLLGQQFTLPVEMPVDVATHAAAGEIRETIAVLLGDQADAFFALRPSIEDIKVLFDQITPMYGITLGEVPASPSS